MSSSLCWRPVKNDWNALPYDLKRILVDKELVGWQPSAFTSEHMAYLAGLRDAGIAGAQELIDLIVKYDTVELVLR